MRKDGELLVNTTVRTILAIGVVLIMVFLIVRIFSPSYSEASQTAKSYSVILKNAIKEADSKGVSNFFMINNGREDLNFYLVYFGKVLEFKKDGLVFRYSGDVGKHVLCVCSEDKSNLVCKSCTDEKLPVRVDGKGNVDYWVVGDGLRLKLVKQGGYYVFSKR